MLIPNPRALSESDQVYFLISLRSPCVSHLPIRSHRPRQFYILAQTGPIQFSPGIWHCKETPGFCTSDEEYLLQLARLSFATKIVNSPKGLSSAFFQSKKSGVKMLCAIQN